MTARAPLNVAGEPGPVVGPVGSPAARGAEVRAEIARVPGRGEPLPDRSVEGWIGVACRLRDHAESLLDENERLRDLVDRQLGDCIGCVDEPDETCPRDGRTYSAWVDIASTVIGRENTRYGDLHDRAVTAEAEVARLTAQLDQPCGSCHPCMNWRDETWRRADRLPPHVHEWDEALAELAAARRVVQAVEALVADIDSECPDDSLPRSGWWDAMDAVRKELRAALAGGTAPITVEAEVYAERERAHAKHGETSMRSQPADSLLRLAILMEEVGEVAKEFNEMRHRGDQSPDMVRLRKELIQTSAMASDWAAAICPGPTDDERPATGQQR